MKRNGKIQTTRKYLRQKFVRVILAALGFAFLPFFLIVMIQNLFGVNRVQENEAAELLRESREDIDVSELLRKGGSAAIVDEDFYVTPLGGDGIFGKDRLSTQEWTDFLCNAEKTMGWETDVAYHDGEDRYFLVIKKPQAVTFSITVFFNREAVHYRKTVASFLAIFSTYFIALILFVAFYSKRAARRMTDSVEEVSRGAQRLESGQYEVDFGNGETAELDELGKAMHHLAGELKAREEIRREEEEKRMLLVSELSHDLKTPLASVQGYSEMLLGRVEDEEKRRDYLKIIHDNSVRANSILQALFTYSKLGSAGYKPEFETVDLCEFSRRIMAEYVPRFEEAGFTYRLAIPEEEILVKMNCDLFRRVYDNLIENSMKYNQAGVTIGMTIAREKDQVRIAVFDDGVGIPKECAERIFTPFYRIDGDVSGKKSGGSGLGLAIVKRIVELHGGEIAYTSVEENHGCRYEIGMPMA